MRAVGIVRVSETKGREGDSFVSPSEQRGRIEEACERDGMALLRVWEEIDVSGGTALEARKGLREAVRAVETSEADVVMVAYFDRLVRSLRVQDEVVSRVEAAGGRVVALDFGEVTGKTAAHWLSATMIGAVSEYHRRSIGERSAEGQARAVARGVAPWPDVPTGYLRGEDGVLTPDPDMKPLILAAWQRRAEGASIRQIWKLLTKSGVSATYNQVQRMFTMRVYLGEIHFGKLTNLSAHEAIVPRDLWQAVQRVRVPRGRQPKSTRLLARLGVLRCSGCGGKMGPSTSYNGRYPIYRCPNSTSGDCPAKVTISAPVAEAFVVDEVKRIYADAEGRASAEQNAREADEAAEKAQADYTAAIRAFAGHDDEPAAIGRLAELRQVRDETRDHANHLSGHRSTFTIRLADDWERLTLDERRAAIQALDLRAIVSPGRGTDRIAIHLFGK